MTKQLAGIDVLVSYHLNKEPIVFKYISKSEETGDTIEIYMIKSITQDNQSYNVVQEGEKWICDCPSYKYRSGVNEQGHCKHIRFVTFLLNEKVEIAVI